jgi:hypothetical protein
LRELYGRGEGFTVFPDWKLNDLKSFIKTLSFVEKLDLLKNIHGKTGKVNYVPSVKVRRVFSV